VHAVRARPLLIIKNNIEPDEQSEEADTIPRGVLTPSHTPLRAHALRYTHLSASSLRSSGSGLFFPRAGASLSRRRAQPEDGTPLPMLFRPTRGLKISAGIRPRGNEIFLFRP